MISSKIQDDLFEVKSCLVQAVLETLGIQVFIRRIIFIPGTSRTVEGLHSYLPELPTAERHSERVTRNHLIYIAWNYHGCMFATFQVPRCVDIHTYIPP